MGNGIFDAFGEDTKAFDSELRERAKRLARDPEFRLLLRKKHERHLDDESVKPLASYCAEELERIRVNFFGGPRSYHEARQRFVFKGNRPPQGSERQFGKKQRLPLGFISQGTA